MRHLNPSQYDHVLDLLRKQTERDGQPRYLLLRKDSDRDSDKVSPLFSYGTVRFYQQEEIKSDPRWSLENALAWDRFDEKGQRVEWYRSPELILRFPDQAPYPTPVTAPKGEVPVSILSSIDPKRYALSKFGALKYASTYDSEVYIVLRLFNHDPVYRHGSSEFYERMSTEGDSRQLCNALGWERYSPQGELLDSWISDKFYDLAREKGIDLFASPTGRLTSSQPEPQELPPKDELWWQKERREQRKRLDALVATRQEIRRFLQGG